MSRWGTAVYGSSVYGAAENPYYSTTGAVMWIVQVDWDNDGLFDGQIEPQTIRSVQIRRGRGSRMRGDGRGQIHPEAESWQIEIRDTARRYDSYNTSSPIYQYLGAPGLLMRMLMVNTTTKAVHEAAFVGMLTNVDYDHRSGVARLSGSGLSLWLELGAAASLYAPCQSITFGAYDPYFVPDGSTPFPINYWRGRPDGLTLRAIVDIILRRAAWPLEGYYGQAVYNNEQPDYFLLDGSTAWEQVKGAADAFAARLLFLRDGRLFAMDRLDPNGRAGVAAPAKALEAPGLERGKPFEGLRNRVEMRTRPHSVTPFKSPYLNSYYLPAWTNAGPVEVAPSSYVDINIKYPSELAKPSQGSFVRVNQDAVSEAYRLEVWSAADKTGVNMGTSGNSEGEFGLILEQIGGNYYQDGNNQSFCTVRLRNWSAVRTAYFFNMQVQVIGIRETGQALTRVAEDVVSVGLNGKRAMEINSRWVQSAEMADAVGWSYLDALSTREAASPAGLTYHWGGADLYDKLVLYDVGAVVDFGAAGGASALANFGMNGKWLIVGQEVTWISPSGQDAFVKLTFEKIITNPVILGNVSSAGGYGVGSITWNHTVAAGTDRLLVVGVGVHGGNVTGVTFGGVALTKLTSQAKAGTASADLWYLVNPAVGVGAIVVSTDGVGEVIEAGGMDFSNVDQASPMYGAAGANYSGLSGSITLTGQSADVLVGLAVYTDYADAVAGLGQVVRWRVSHVEDTGYRRSVFGTKQRAGGGSAMAWTLATYYDWWVQAGGVVRAK